MKRILYEVPKWHAYLHRDARGMVRAQEDDAAPLRFQDEVFDKLYSGGDPEQLPEEQQEQSMKKWATEVHGAADQLPDFQRLQAQVRGDALASAIATESVLQAVQESLAKAQHQANQDGRTLQAGGSGPLSQEAKDAIRKGIRRGVTRAQKDVEEVREGMQGIEHVGVGAGAESGQHTGQNNTQRVVAVAKMIKNDARLRRIATLAGKFKRIAENKRKQKVKHGADELTDVEQGNDLGRLLPSELMRLAHPKLKLAMLRDFTERKTLQYHLEGCEELGKGPIVVCLDKSGSMHGERDMWASAVALALLDKAQREKRRFALICFDSRVLYESPVVKPGEKLPYEGLYVEPSGGTSFEVALDRAMDIIDQNQGTMKRADIVLVTDGGSYDAMTPELVEAKARLGVNILGVAIGFEKSVMDPWCDTSVGIENLDTIEDSAARAMFADM